MIGGNLLMGAFPPSSKTIGLRCLPAVLAIILPTRVDPVKLHHTKDNLSCLPLGFFEVCNLYSLDFANSGVSNNLFDNTGSILSSYMDNGENSSG